MCFCLLWAFICAADLDWRISHNHTEWSCVKFMTANIQCTFSTLAVLLHFPTPSLSRYANDSFVVSSLSSNISSSILALSELLWFLFYWENWSNTRRPVATHLAISVPIYFPFPSVAVHIQSGHLSKAILYTCALDPLLSHQPRDTPPVIDPFLPCSHQFFPFDHSVSR